MDLFIFGFKEDKIDFQTVKLRFLPDDKEKVDETTTHQSGELCKYF